MDDQIEAKTQYGFDERDEKTADNIGHEAGARVRRESTYFLPAVRVPSATRFFPLL